ncbi:hypothetical protein [Streptomyces sp. NPDC057854]|uniref:hypothetical protein n=1 Tax=unclassified Streptomyces TaxID=2593676 RepID=UPI00368EB53D
MCGFVKDVAAKGAAIEGLLRRHPGAPDAGRGRPSLQGCEDVPWAGFAGCPAALPLVLRALFDQTAAPEAQGVLSGVLFDDVATMNAAMPAALPFLLRLASDPGVPVRVELRDVVVTAAELSESVAGQSEAWVLWYGADEDRPERALCRAVFAAHADVVASLAADVADPARRASLRQAAGLL